MFLRYFPHGLTLAEKQAFSVTPRDNGAFLPRVLSRKKQIVPMLSALWA